MDRKLLYEWRPRPTYLKSGRTSWRRMVEGGPEQLAECSMYRASPMAVSHPCHPLVENSLFVPLGKLLHPPLLGNILARARWQGFVLRTGSEKHRRWCHQCVLALLALPIDSQVSRSQLPCLCTLVSVNCHPYPVVSEGGSAQQVTLLSRAVVAVTKIGSESQAHAQCWHLGD